MIITYDRNKRIFIKQNYQKHSGGGPCASNVYAEGFYVNKFINETQGTISPFIFDTPKYSTMGGTLNYYSQDYWSIFTNIARPFINFNFTANTSSFGENTIIKHQIYKIPYNEYVKYTSEVERKAIEQDLDTTEETLEESTIDEDGSVAKKITTKKTIRKNTSEKIKPSEFPEDIDGYEFNSSKNLLKIQNLLSNPILTITASTSDIETSTYSLFLDEYQKNLGDHSFQLFEDYSQYFISTQFIFSGETDSSLTEFCFLDENKNLVNTEQPYVGSGITEAPSHVITGGTFSGITVIGNHFTYFLIPNKPKWIEPYVSGQLETFSPTFYWANTNDADSFVLQVTYDPDESSTAFTGTVFSYPINLQDTRLSTEEMLGMDEEPWSITQKTTDIIREYSVPLKANKNFWYRIGNIKELINIFGVKQSVVTFSDARSASTLNQQYNSAIYVQPDSPHTTESPSWIYPSYLDDELISGDLSLSGTVSGSVVTGATIQLELPNGNFITKPTDLVGNFVFDDLEAGNYIIHASYRGYENNSKNVNLTGNTDVGIIKLKLIWGNKWDTWGSMADEVYSP
jgi:hypothetical protein